ncbi:hypothetical protein NLG97_g10831 [Lecanicillium saksenae]|uniref:Uncharacterized protein n=1 Tax=Lecanicillium saksenae TaxID=468837 RepID=A0ACC1QCL1_9HYPO|nr:hypothetical protein NLG97_g10831 [Lecanicillium saksenae]
MLILYALGAALASILAVSLYRAAADPLRSIPGPFLARFNRLWYLAAIARGRFDSENVELHRRYGPVVRVAPGTYSLDVPEAVGSVYGVASRMPKSEWYDAWTTAGAENRSLFSDRDARRHAETRKLFQALYNMSNLVSYEGYVDDCTDVLTRQLDGFAERKESLDAFHWFQYYAFDVIAGITTRRA